MLFAAFALAIGVAMAHEFQIPQYCLRIIQRVAGK